MKRAFVAALAAQVCLAAALAAPAAAASSPTPNVAPAAQPITAPHHVHGDDFYADQSICDLPATLTIRDQYSLTLWTDRKGGSWQAGTETLTWTNPASGHWVKVLYAATARFSSSMSADGTREFDNSTISGVWDTKVTWDGKVFRQAGSIQYTQVVDVRTGAVAPRPLVAYELGKWPFVNSGYRPDGVSNLGCRVFTSALS